MLELHQPLLLDPLLSLAHALRGAGVPVSTSELIDATAALAEIDQLDRPVVKGALSATLIKRQRDRAVFDALFDLHFASRAARPQAADGQDRQGSRRREIETSLDRPEDDGVEGDESGSLEAGDPSTDLLAELAEALRLGDMAALRRLAGMAVDQFGGMERQTGASERYFLYRVLRALQLSQLMARALREDREVGDGDAVDRGDPATRAELVARIEAFRKMLAEQIRGHLAELVGAAEAGASMTPLSIDETDFLGASPRQLASMREAIRPLARVLASKLARRRRRRDRGRLDVRRTVRRSLSTGGVPLDPAFRRPRLDRPDLYVLCDVSGSVAEFASFTLTLLQAMGDEFPRLRSFAFVDAIDEVTDELKDVASFLEVRHVLYRADVVRGDGHSDYGTVLEQFWERYASAVDSRSTVIVTGDARGNGRPPGDEFLCQLRDRARAVYLLNPEPAAEWNTTDSVVAVFEPYLDGVFEVRNLEQLAEAVLAIG